MISTTEDQTATTEDYEESKSLNQKLQEALQRANRLDLNILAYKELVVAKNEQIEQLRADLYQLEQAIPRNHRPQNSWKTIDSKDSICYEGKEKDSEWTWTCNYP